MHYLVGIIVSFILVICSGCRKHHKSTVDQASWVPELPVGTENTVSTPMAEETASRYTAVYFTIENVPILNSEFKYSLQGANATWNMFLSYLPFFPPSLTIGIKYVIEV